MRLNMGAAKEARELGARCRYQGFLRPRQSRVAVEVRQASSSRQPNAAADPEMAEGGRFGRRRVVGDDGWVRRKEQWLHRCWLTYTCTMCSTCGVEVWRQKIAQGDMIVVRYADDLVAGCQHQADAERFLRDFQERLAKFGLEVHPGETRLIEFGRFAASARRKRGAEAGNSRSSGSRTSLWHELKRPFCGLAAYGGKADEGKTPSDSTELRRMMHEPVALVGAWLKRVVEGYYRYHAVPGNLSVLSRFRGTALPLLAACSTPAQSAA